MWCPKCDGGTKTTDTRKFQDVSQTFDFVRRLRVCRECGHKFLTIEVLQSIWETYHEDDDYQNEDFD